MSLSYTTVDYIIAEEPSVNSITDVQSSTLFKFAEDAEAEINIRLALRYEIPVSGSPPALRAYATDVAIYRTLRRAFSQERLQKSTWVDSYKEALDRVDMLSSGKHVLVDSAGAVIAARTDLREVWSNTKDYAPSVAELHPTRLRTDPDKVDDLEDARDITNQDLVKW